MPNLGLIRLNRIRLDSCEQHCFEVEGVEIAPGQKVTCRNCKGEMSLVHANEYIRGFAAAGGDPLKVWANWCEADKELETRCPQCLGATFIEPMPEDYFDCDLCEATGFVTVSTARTYLKEQDECQTMKQ